jgi:hypothetical protein
MTLLVLAAGLQGCDRFYQSRVLALIAATANGADHI